MQNTLIEAFCNVTLLHLAFTCYKEYIQLLTYFLSFFHQAWSIVGFLPFVKPPGQTVFIQTSEMQDKHKLFPPDQQAHVQQPRVPQQEGQGGARAHLEDQPQEPVLDFVELLLHSTAHLHPGSTSSQQGGDAASLPQG